MEALLSVAWARTPSGPLSHGHSGGPPIRARSGLRHFGPVLSPASIGVRPQLVLWAAGARILARSTCPYVLVHTFAIVQHLRRSDDRNRIPCVLQQFQQPYA